TGPATPSYTSDVYPILERARTTEWVVQVFGAHAWPDPVYDDATRTAIFNRLANPAGGGGNMPRLNSATLTPTQYQVMLNWKNDTFTRDWVAPPPPPPGITPAGLDQSALINCVGAAFFPGIEAGGIAGTPIIDHANYVGASDPLRLNQAVVSAGDMSRYMALPWQADFKACASNWWPVPRPNSVIPEGTSSYQAWDRGVGTMLDMVSKWHSLGFVVKQGSQYVEVDRCDATYITLLTPHLDFQDVPEGPMGMSRKTALAIEFEVSSTGAAVTLEVQPGDGPTHPRVTLSAPSVTVGPTTGSAIATARLWVLYETGPVGEVVTTQATVRHVASSSAWTVTISANTVARRVTATALVLDRSGSMSEDRGDGQTKHDSLVEAASIMVDLALDGDGIGVVRFNEDAQVLQGVTALGPASDPFDPARLGTKNIVSGTGLAPSGSTSIGDGIFEGRGILDSAGGSYAGKAMVVLTDGVENQPRWIADVAPQINALTYAVGLGTPQNTSAAALQTISGNHGGYLLLTGAISGDNRFILQKYFLQILAGISNAEIVLDPQGNLIPGREQRIPFQLTEADAGVDVIVLTPNAEIVDFRLETPNGLVIEPWRALAEPSMVFSLAPLRSFYRVVLPTELIPARFDQAGTWHALLTIGKPRVNRPDVPQATFGRHRIDVPVEHHRTAVEAVALAAEQRTVPYSLVVHAYSNLSLRAAAHQSGFEPGATVALEATLAESGIPARAGAHVWTELARPNGVRETVVLRETVPGHFVGNFATGAAGIYRCRVRATGTSSAGYAFQREQTVTAAVWQGGDRDADPQCTGGGPVVRWLEEHDRKLCQLLRCILGEGGALSHDCAKRLHAAGVDLERLRHCLEACCKPVKPGRDG
ncbi:MAG: VWA domain-containing protein, partial [Deltaproteobacteria bacterium]